MRNLSKQVRWTLYDGFSESTDRQTDGCYQMYYLPYFAVDNYVFLCNVSNTLTPYEEVSCPQLTPQFDIIH